MKWQKPDREGWAYVQGEGDRPQQIFECEKQGRWAYSCRKSRAYYLQDALVCYIPGPPAEWEQDGPQLPVERMLPESEVRRVLEDAMEVYADDKWGQDCAQYVAASLKMPTLKVFGE